jgi:outer membrane protein OmpA-like peptidoglycan-associated protein
MWLPNETFNSLIWGDYIIELPEYTQRRDGASFMGADLTDFLSNMEFEQMRTEEHYDDRVSVLPLRIVTGPRNIKQVQADAPALEKALEKIGYGYIMYDAYSEVSQDTNFSYIGKPYKVEGNKIKIYLEWWYREDNEIEVDSESAIEFEFRFEGFVLVLSRDGLTRRMVPRQFMDEEPLIMLEHHSGDNLFLEEVAYIEHIDTPRRADGTVNPDDGSLISFDNEPRSIGNNAVDTLIELYKSGIMRINWDGRFNALGVLEPDEAEFWIRYIWCGSDGIILIDNNGQYYLYQTHREDYVPLPLEVEPEEVPIELTLLERLEIALKEAGFELAVDTRRGTVTADANFLFGQGERTLDDTRKKNLGKYLDVIDAVLQSEEYTGSVAKIIVEGHTCKIGGPAHNMKLSEDRAAAVKEFASSGWPALSDIMETVGKAFDEMIKDENGNEDEEKSRRVVFRFVLSTPVA